MKEELIKIKEMIQNNECEKAIKYIDKLLKKNDAESYIDNLVSELK